MSKMNVLISLNAYNDENPTNHPSQSNFKWVLDLQGIDVSEPRSASVRLNPGEVMSLFNGAVSIAADGTTTYDINLKALTSSTYQVKHNAGTAPVFRTARAPGVDATTEITVTKNATLLTFTSTAGTALNLIVGGAIVGDQVRIGTGFNVVNQGKFTILSRTATSFTVENVNGQAEGPIVLGASFAEQISIYSAAGVQIGDKVKISNGFSSVSFGTFEITDVAPDYIEFYSLKALPTETAIQATLNIYNNSKQFMYLETNKKVSLTIDGVANGSVEPFLVGTKVKAGAFLKNSPMFSASITNDTQEIVTVFYATVE